MKPKLMLIIVSALAVFSSTAQAELPAAYDFTFIPRIFNASDINNAGQVVGGGSVARDHAYLWESGNTIVLGDPVASAAANGINNKRQIVGFLSPIPHVYEGSTAMLWTKYTTTTLDHLEANGTSEALAINDKGQVVGSSTVGFVDGNWPGDYMAPVLWNGQTPPTRLANVESAGNVIVEARVATDINNKGQIVGWGVNRNASGNFQPDHALIWDGENVAEIDPGKYFSRAEAINDAGQVVGIASVGDPFGSDYGERAHLWSNGAGTLLDSFGQYSIAKDINNEGLIVGYSVLSGNEYATMWDEQGDFYDLNSFLNAETKQAGWQLLEATAINDLGQVVGHAYNSITVDYGSFVLNPIPVPEPETYAMLVAGLGLLGLTARKRKAPTVAST